MSKKYLFNACFILAAAFLSFNLISCSAPKKIKYFEDIPDSGRLTTLKTSSYNAPTIQIDDILTIILQTVDPQASANVNIGNVPIQSSSVSSSSAISPQAASSGYLVSKDGFVEIPVLGKIKVVGLTTEQAKEAISKVANDYYKDPTVIVRYANFKFSVTGEVAKPGVYVTPNERVSVLDAISLAGDLTIFGKRDNVLLIRDNLDGTKTPYRINLTKSDIFSSPYYYLRQNDILYIEPGKGKAAANDAAQARTFAIISSFVSVLIVVVSRIKF